jgi:hypothetical protein
MKINDSRDLKPGNCLISIGRGAIPKVLVGDFGEGHVEGSGEVGTGTIEVSYATILLTIVYGTGTH